MFYVTITNSYGCTDHDSILVDVNDFSAYITNVEPVKCNNDCNGQIAIGITGGVAPYSFEWNTGASTPTITNLCAGHYIVTITDAIGCFFVLDTLLINPPVLQASISVISNAQCDSIHPNTGAISVSVTGGTEPYFYFWNNGMTTPQINNLYAGTYIVTVIDKHGCDTILLATVTDPSTLQILVTVDSANCYGSCDGSATVYITEQSTPPYLYFWNTGETTTTISNLCAGIYSVTVKDAENCFRAAYVYVAQPDSLNAILNVPPIKCNGGNTTVTLSHITGGTPPYNYLWFNGAYNVSSIENITAGTYWIFITDAHSCSDTIFFNITEPPHIFADTNITLPLCLHSCNGKISLVTSGGTFPYYYNWNTGENTSTITNLCQGAYSVTITDANGCTATYEIIITHQNYSPPLNAMANPQVIYVGQTTQLMANTLSENYSYFWWPSNNLSNQYIQNPKAKPPSTITYYVSVTDAFGCTNIDSVQIIVMDVICEEPYIYVPNAFTPNNDGINDVLYLHAPMAIDVYFAIYDRWGECVFETTSVNKGWDGTYKGVLLDPAVFVYYLKVKCINNIYFEKKGNITLIR
ncbi:MAG: gliding motility-associated C-terminal domain-containing protein [Bacteroidales bacterium]|nr:gliding motility-associated C-terminal domain-containing protein [Bacteroidales bacterium]